MLLNVEFLKFKNKGSIQSKQVSVYSPWGSNPSPSACEEEAVQ